MKLEYVYQISMLTVAALLFPSAVQAQLSTTGAAQVPPGIAPNQAVSEPAAPANGNFIVFSSKSTNLTGSSSGFKEDISYIFRFDNTTKLTSVLSTNTSGAPSISAPLSGGAFQPAVSDVAPDGTTYGVVFSSTATDLVANTSNEFFYRQVYLKIPSLPEGSNTFLLSRAFGQSGNIAASGNSEAPTIVTKSLSPLVFRVCFTTTASDLVTSGGTTPGASKIACGDFASDGTRQGEWTVLEQSAGGGNTSPGSFLYPRLSGDGQTVVFGSNGAIPGFPSSGNFREQVYTYSFNTKQYSLISRSANGTAADGRSVYPTISYLGTFIGFTYYPSQGTNPLIGASGTRADFILYKVSDGSFTVVNNNATDSASSDQSFGAQLGQIDRSANLCVFSDNGRGILGFIDPNSDGRTYQVYVKSLVGKAITRVSVNSALQSGNGNSGLIKSSAPIALGGSGYANPSPYAAFISDATNLASAGTPVSGFEYLFSAPISSAGTSASRTFTRNISIEAPPDVRITKIRKRGGDITLTLESFIFDRSIFKAKALDLAVLASKRARLTYAVEIRKDGSRQRISRVSSRNTLTVRKLAPGSYTARYRAVATNGKRTIRSQFSPVATFVLS